MFIYICLFHTHMVYCYIMTNVGLFCSLIIDLNVVANG